MEPSFKGSRQGICEEVYTLLGGLVAAVITVDDVRQLLASDEVEPVLVLSGGKTSVVGTAALDSGPYAGAVVVADRGQLVRELPELNADSGEFALQEVAARLSVEIAQLGG
jgi:hypothetical protein